MPYYVYIIKSLRDGSFYKGYTTNYAKRLEQHNNGDSKYTSSKMPWKLIYVEEFISKKDALLREKSLKHANSSYLKWLIGQPCNLLLKN